MMDTFEPLGISFAAIHSGHEFSLARRLSIHGLPCLVLILDGNPYVFKDIFDLSKVIGKNKMMFLFSIILNFNF